MTDARSTDAVLVAVHERIDPDDEERQRLAAVAARLTERAEDVIADLPVSADVLQVGSTARGTWISGDRDIDLFVRFPPDLSREDLETYGLRVGTAVLPEGREEYAEHPYIKGEFDGFDVDLVPCYAVDSAADIQSAVDRTPFHNEYLRTHLDEDLAADVRLLKQFLKGIRAYGSDLRTQGFSGYLTELLVLEYGSFEAVIEAAADWSPPIRFDPEDHGTREFDDPLVVIDPTDPERNVAAVLSQTNVARVQHYAREFVGQPSTELFFPAPREPLSPDAVRTHIGERATTPVALRFPAPDVVEDELYPQLRKSLAGIAAGLNRRGFDVIRRDAFASETAVLLFELAVDERPSIERHDGPPVHVRPHASGFYEKYAGSDAYGPFIDGDRYVVERPREFTTAEAFLRSDALLDVALGVHVKSRLEDGYDLLVGDETAALADEFGRELAAYFSPEP